MIGRRAFTLGLASTLLSPAAWAGTGLFGRSAQDRDHTPLKPVPYTPFEDVPDHRGMMRTLVGQLADYCHQRHPAMVLLARNAPELIVKGKREWEWQSWHDPKAADAGKIPPQGSINHDYLDQIDGLVLDGVFCGLESYGTPTASPDTARLLTAARAAKTAGKTVFLIDYGPDKALAATIERNAQKDRFVSVIDRSGDETQAHLPKGAPARENAAHVMAIGAARNLLVMESADAFKSRTDWVTALATTNYDVLVLTPFDRDGHPLTAAEIERLKMKKLGTKRMVLAIMSASRAREGAYYWNPDWSAGNPPWLVARSPGDSARWVVEYWNDAWKKIMGTYIESVASLGFDGVMLDDVAGYLPFEDMLPID